jgi:hypothetical protein
MSNQRQHQSSHRASEWNERHDGRFADNQHAAQQHDNGHHQEANSMADHFQVFATSFTALNNSGVAGGAAIVLDKASHTVTVEIDATGLEANQVHVQHIHGFLDDTKSHSPTLAQDTDHDGFVELGEGLATYGQILLNLSLNPENSTHDHGTASHDHTNLAQFPTADANGNLHYQETFHFDAKDPNAMAIFNSIENLSQKEIVLHGETVAAGSGAGTSGEVDGTAGYKAVLPVASGEIHAVNSHEAATILQDFTHDQFAADHSLSDFLLGHHA